jgi:hypothetical protein
MPLPDWFKSRATPDGATPDTPLDDDDAHRIHIAANDPAYPAKREAAVTLICAAIDAIATPMGYTRKGTTWSRSSPRGRTIINLQRSQYGWHADINLRYILPNGEAASHGAWAGGYDVRIGMFYKPGEGHGSEPGRLAYLDISEDPATLDLPMHILHTRALPWLATHHQGTLGIAHPLPT